MRQPRGIGRRVIGADGRDPAVAERGEARIGRLTFRLPVDAKCSVLGDADAAAQPVEREALGKRGRGGRFAIEQEVGPVCPDQKIEQRLALRAEQPGPSNGVRSCVTDRGAAA
jgi:hypothetical protein